MRSGMTRVLLLGVLLLGAALVACGGGDADETSSDDTTATATEASGGGGDEALIKEGRTVSAGVCWGCHTQDGSASVGPTWLGLYGTTATLDDGSTVEVDEAYVRESITDPSAKVVEGFAAGTMPQFTTLTDADIDAIVAYIKSLGE